MLSLLNKDHPGIPLLTPQWKATLNSPIDWLRMWGIAALAEVNDWIRILLPLCVPVLMLFRVVTGMHYLRVKTGEREH